MDWEKSKIKSPSSVVTLLATVDRRTFHVATVVGTKLVRPDSPILSFGSGLYTAVHDKSYWQQARNKPPRWPLYVCGLSFPDVCNVIAGDTIIAFVMSDDGITASGSVRQSCEIDCGKCIFSASRRLLWKMPKSRGYVKHWNVHCCRFECPMSD